LSFDFRDGKAKVCLDETEISVGLDGAWTGPQEFTFFIRSASRMATDKVICSFVGSRVTVQVLIDPQKNAGSQIVPLVLTGEL